MRPPTVPVRCLLVMLCLLAMLTLGACDSSTRGHTAPASAAPANSAKTGPTLVTSTPVGAGGPATTPLSIPPATNSALGTAPPTTATPGLPTVTAGTNTLVLVVSGAGTGTSTLVGVTCTASAVHASTDGGGQVLLDTASGVLQLTAVDPVGTLTLSGTAHRDAGSVTYSGTTTGTSAALRVTC